MDRGFLVRSHPHPNFNELMGKLGKADMMNISAKIFSDR